MGGLGFVSFSRTSFDSEGWDGGALGCWRLGPVRPCPELAASLIVALLPVSGLIGAGETRAAFMAATVVHLKSEHEEGRKGKKEQRELSGASQLMRVLN